MPESDPGDRSIVSKYMAMLYAYCMALADSVPSLEDEILTVGDAAFSPRARASQTRTVIMGVVIAATLLVGLFVVASLNDALPSISNAGLSSARDSVVTRVGDAMVIGAVTIIVLFSAVILRVLRGL